MDREDQYGFNFGSTIREQKPKAIADAEERSIQERFKQFHGKNPRVYSELVSLARTWRRRHGNRTLGIKMLWEVMRWNIFMKTEGNTEDDFKLCNDYHSRYARLIMETEPDLTDAFATRELRAL